MTPVARNRLILVAALAVAGGALAFIAWGGIGENLVYYWSPGELLAQGKKAYGPTIRLGGVVQNNSIQWNAQHTSLKFRVADGMLPESPSIEVHSDQIPPQMFRHGIGVVVEGTYDKSQVFKTSRLMVKHSNEYRAPKEGEAGKDWGKATLSDSSMSATPPSGMPHPPGGPTANAPTPAPEPTPTPAPGTTPASGGTNTDAVTP